MKLINDDHRGENESNKALNTYVSLGLNTWCMDGQDRLAFFVFQPKYKFKCH
jgi:hypothetical protein